MLIPGSSTGNAGGWLCPLHQSVPWLWAADADGLQITFLLHPGNHGWIQRSVFSLQFFRVFLFPLCVQRLHWQSISSLCSYLCISYFLILSELGKSNSCMNLKTCQTWEWCLPFLFGLEMSRAKNELQRTPIFMALYHEMEAMFLKPPAGTWLHSN